MSIKNKKIKRNHDELDAPVKDSETVQVNGGSDKNEEPQNESVTVDENPASKSKKMMRFAPKVFRQSLATKDAHTNIKQFVMLCLESKSTMDFAQQFMDVGGNCLEIIHVLDTAERKNITYATPIFQAITIILLKIQATAPNYIPNAEEACRHLLNNYSTTIHAVLSSEATAKQHKVVLKLLTAVVTLSPSLAKEILTHVNIDETILTHLTDPPSNPNSLDSVRTHFIHFLLSFMIDGTPGNIKAFLEKKGLLASIFANLLYDNYQTVNLVLTALQKHILENPAISKTLKLHTFNTPVLKSLVNLYNWKGHKYWQLKVRKKSKVSTEGLVDAVQKEVVCESVHNFLLILCTSFKYGVVFHDHSLGLSGKKCNSLILTVLEGLDKPWEHKFASQLVLRIAKSCPDLFKFISLSVENYLEPRVSVKWLNVMMFLKELFSSIASHLSESDIKNLNAKQFLILIQTMCVPHVVIKKLSNRNVINHTDRIIRDVVIDLLVTILNNLSTLLILAQKYVAKSEYNNLKLALHEYLMRDLPAASLLVESWSNDNNDANRECTEIFGEYAKSINSKISLLHLLIFYYKIDPHSLDGIQRNFDPVTLLMSIQDASVTIKHEIALKATELFVLLNSSSFMPDASYFKDYMTILLSQTDHLTISVVTDICQKSHIFDKCEDEIVIWLEPLNLFDEGVKTLLISAIERAHKMLSIQTKKIVTIKNSVAINQSMTYDEEDTFELLEYGSVHCANVQINDVTLSPLVINILDLLTDSNSEFFTNDNAWKYFSIVAIHLLHSQTLPEILLEILSEYKFNKKNCRDFQKYITAWNQSHPIALQIEYVNPLYINVSQAILQDEKININSTFLLQESQQNNELLKIQSMGSDFYINPELRQQYNINLYHLILFNFTQHAKKQILTEQIAENCFSALENLSEIIECSKTHDLNVLLRLVYNNPIIQTLFSPLCRTKKIFENFVTIFLLNITEYFTKKLSKSSIQPFLKPFKEKILTRISASCKKYDKQISTEKSQIAMKLLNMIDMNSEELLSIVKDVCTIPREFMISQANSLSLFANILAHCLQQMSLIGNDSNLNLLGNDISKIANHYVFVRRYHVLINMDYFTESLLLLLQTLPHLVKKISVDIFNSILDVSEVTRTDCRLVQFLIRKNKKLLKITISKLNDLLPKKDLMFTLLNHFINIEEFVEENKCDLLFKEYEQIINKSIDKPHKVGVTVRENYPVIIQLIKTSMQVETCSKIASKIHKYDVVESFHLEILETIFMKAWTHENKEVFLTNFIQILLHLIVNSIKRNEQDKVRCVCDKLQSFLTIVNINLEKLHLTAIWNQFCKVALKNGLKVTVCVSLESVEKTILRTLKVLCLKVYSSNESVSKDIAILYEMIISHSEFLNIILGETDQKFELLQILLILAENNKAVMSMNLIPVFLGAYNATNHVNDKILLALLSLYETSNVSLYDYRPYLWGEFAVNHYSVRRNIESALWRQPSMGQVLDLLHSNIVNNTITNFDTKRKLFISTDERLEILNCNEEELLANLSKNGIDRLAVKNKKGCKIDNEDTTTTNCYDPTFYIPLFSHLLSSESVVQCYKFRQAGGLSMTLLAMASEDVFMRQAAYNVLARYFFHLEANSSINEKKIWIEFMNTIRRSILNFTKDEDMTKSQIPLICAVFLARAALIMTQPLNPLYNAITNFIFVKSTIDFSIVPELLQLFHSPDVEFRVQRNWILHVIRDGLKSECDFNILNKSVVFKMLLDFYFCHLADNDVQLLILQIIDKAMLISVAGKFLLCTVGLVTWLNEVSSHSIRQKHEKKIMLTFSICDRILDMFKNTVNSSEITSSEQNLLSYNVISIILKLQNMLPVNFSIENYLQFNKILSEAIISFPQLLSKE